MSALSSQKISNPMDSINSILPCGTIYSISNGPNDISLTSVSILYEERITAYHIEFWISGEMFVNFAVEDFVDEKLSGPRLKKDQYKTLIKYTQAYYQKQGLDGVNWSWGTKCNGFCVIIYNFCHKNAFKHILWIMSTFLLSPLYLKWLLERHYLCQLDIHWFAQKRRNSIANARLSCTSPSI